MWWICTTLNKLKQHDLGDPHQGQGDVNTAQGPRELVAEFAQVLSRRRSKEERTGFEGIAKEVILIWNLIGPQRGTSGQTPLPVKLVPTPMNS